MIYKDAYFKELEEKLLNPDSRKSVKDISELLSDKFLEFASSGKIYSKEGTIELLKKESSVQITIHDFKLILLAPEVALITYSAVKKDSANNEITSLRSSVWKKNGEQWKIEFHQGTIVG